VQKKVFRRDSGLHDNTIDRDLPQTSAINDQTQMLGLMTKSKPNKLNDPLFDEESQIGQTFENRHTLICQDNEYSENTAIFTSQMYHTPLGLHSSNPKVRPWSKENYVYRLKRKNKGLKQQHHLATLKSGI
jgi:hypothetical protein